MPAEIPEKSSFLKREMSKEDAVKQIYRPRVGGQISQAMDIFDRLVGDCETITKLGAVVKANGQTFHLTPDDLKTNLDEFPELDAIATKGRALLTALGYVSRRNELPAVTATVGKTVEVQKAEFQLPGQAPLQGAIINPKA